MIAFLAVLAAALATVLWLLASARARLHELQSRLEASAAENAGLDAALEQARGQLVAAEAARARLEALDQTQRATFAALAREALDANSRRLVEINQQAIARVQDSS